VCVQAAENIANQDEVDGDDVDTNSQTETSRVNLKPEAIIYVYIKKYGACLFLMSELVQLCALLVFF